MDNSIQDTFFKRIRSCDDLMNAIHLVAKKRLQSTQKISEKLKQVHAELLSLHTNLIPIDIILLIFSFVLWKRNDRFDIFYEENEQCYFKLLFALRQLSRLHRNYYDRKEFWTFAKVHVEKRAKAFQFVEGKAGWIQELHLKVDREITSRSFYTESFNELKQFKAQCKLFPTTFQLPYFFNLVELTVENAEIPSLPKFSSLEKLHFINTAVNNFTYFEAPKLLHLFIKTTNADSRLTATAKTLFQHVHDSNLLYVGIDSCTNNFISLLLALCQLPFFKSLKGLFLACTSEDEEVANFLIYALSFKMGRELEELELTFPNLNAPLELLDIASQFQCKKLAMTLNFLTTEQRASVLFDFTIATTIVLLGSIPVQASSFSNSPVEKLSLLCDSVPREECICILKSCTKLKALEIEANQAYPFHSLIQCIIQHPSIEKVKISRKLLTIPLVQHLKVHFGNRVCIS